MKPMPALGLGPPSSYARQRNPPPGTQMTKIPLETSDTRGGRPDEAEHQPDAVHSRAEPAEPMSAPWGLALLVVGIAWVWVAAGWTFVVVILSLLFMIFMHELGHYLAARRAGMKVTEFFIGFGPRLWSFRRGDTEYGIKAIWLGAYVKVIGMNALDPVEPHEEARTYRQGSYGARILLAVAGSAMHFIMAFVMLYVLLVGFGIDADETAWTVNDVVEGSAAEEAGIVPGDRILTIDGEDATAWPDMVTLIEAHPNEPVVIGYERDGVALEAEATLGLKPDANQGSLGVRRSDFDGIEVSAIDAVPQAFETFASFTGDTIIGIGRVFSPAGVVDLVDRAFFDGSDEAIAGGETLDEDSNRVISVIGATRIGADLTGRGFDGLLRFMISINIFVGLLNLAPLLPLDGGHVMVATYEKIRELQTKQRRYHVDAERLLPLTYAVLMVLAVVGISAIYLDIADPISL
jgi:membrane-associated protease RseP (regulator of RpoE activity)